MPTLNLGRVRLNARGAYDNSASYEPLDVVSINGSSYFCRLPVQGVQPGTLGADSFWQFLVGEFDLADTVLITGSGEDGLIDSLDKRIIYVDSLAEMQGLIGNPLKDNQQIHVKNVGMFVYENGTFVPQSVNVQAGESFPSLPVKDQLFILEPDGLYYYNGNEWVALINIDLLQSKVDEAEAFADAAESQADRAAQEVNDGIITGIASGVEQVSAFVSTEADRAEAAGDRAKESSDLAINIVETGLASSMLYADEEAGRAAVQDDQYYYAVSDDPIVSKTLYQRVSESESQWIADDPSAALVRSLGLFVDAQSDIRQELLNTLSAAGRSCAFDFTNRRTFWLDADTQSRVERVLPIVGDIDLTGGSEPPTLLTQSNGLTGVGQPDGTEGRQRLFTETPLIQNYPCTLVLSQQTDVEGSSRTIFWQQGTGGDGNIQVTSNRRVVDGSLSTFSAQASVYIQGSEFPDGSNSCNFNWTLRRGNTLALVLRAPPEDSELWVNGLLVSTFTAPPQILQANSYLMGDNGPGTPADGATVGRCIAVDAALSGDDLRRAGEWVAQGLGQSWLSPVVTESQVQTPATCAAIYLLPKSSVGDGNATDLSNARLLYAKSPTFRLRPASTIKTLTTLVAERNIDDLDQLFTVTSDDITGGSGNNLLEGDQITARDALYNLMIASSNTTANLIARSVGELILNNEGSGGDPYDRFITEMGNVAETIGMDATTVSNPSGLNVGTTRSNADDLAKLLITAISAPLTNDLLKTRSHSFAVIGDNARIVDVSLNVDLPLYDDMVHRKGGNLVGSFGKVNSYMASFMAPNGDLIVGTMLWEDSPSEISSASDTLYDLVKAVEKEVRWPALNKPENQRLISPVSIDERISNLVRGYDSNLFDFTNPRAYVTNGEIGSGYRIKHLASLTSSRALRYSGEPSVTNTDGGTLVAQVPEGASGFVSETPLVTQFPSTLAFSLKADSNNRIYAFYQSASEEEGRLQVILNGEYNGSILSSSPGKMQVFVDGATGGSGVDGQPVAADVSRGRSVCGIVVFREGVGQSEIWVNGELVDTFTMPPEPYQGQSRIVRNAMPEEVDASYARLLTLNRDVNAAEIDVLGEWLADGYGEQWSGEDEDEDLPAATGADSYLVSVVDPETPADIFDFTNAAFAERRPQRGELFPAHRAFIGSGQFSGDVLAIREAGKIMPGQPADIDGRLYYQSDKPLLPELGDFTFFGSTRMDGDQTGNRTLIWQHSGGEPGRVQCVLNGGFRGSSQGTIDDGVGIWADGITDGAGLDGSPRKGSAVRGLPVNYVVVMRDGGNASEFWLNGELVDTFTRPPSIAQTTTDLMGTGGSGDQSGRSYGRFGVIHRALDEDEVALVGQWVADAYNDQWERQSLASLSTTGVTTGVLPEAHAAVSYLLSPSSAPEKLNQYKKLKPLFLRGHQQILYPASMTKVLTTMVMLDHISDTDMELEMINGDQTGGSGNNIDPGDILSVSDAIYNMMLPSSNVTTSVVARIVGEMLGGTGTGSDSTSRALFVGAMNAKARQLGMLNSNFTNPSGLADTEMVTTAEDFGRLCANVPNYPELFNRWGEISHTLIIRGPNPRQQNIGHSAGSIMNSRNDIQGGKTGTVGSSPQGSTTRNFVWIAHAPNGNFTANVVMLTTREDRYDDANALLDHVNKNMRWPINQSA